MSIPDLAGHARHSLAPSMPPQAAQDVLVCKVLRRSPDGAGSRMSCRDEIAAEGRPGCLVPAVDVDMLVRAGGDGGPEGRDGNGGRDHDRGQDKRRTHARDSMPLRLCRCCAARHHAKNPHQLGRAVKSPKRLLPGDGPDGESTHPYRRSALLLRTGRADVDRIEWVAPPQPCLAGGLADPGGCSKRRGPVLRWST